MLNKWLKIIIYYYFEVCFECDCLGHLFQSQNIIRMVTFLSSAALVAR